MSRRRALFTEPDLRRAIKVVQDMGIMDQVRVVITADGSIAVEPLPEATEVIEMNTRPAEQPTLRLVSEDMIAL